MSRQLIKLKTVQNMIEDTPNSNFSSQPKYKHASLGRDRKVREGVQPPHSRGGGGCASGSEAAAPAASMSKEAATVDWSLVVCVGSGGRPRWLMIRRSMA